MPNYQGVWSLSEQYQAIGQQNWPMAPGAPTGVSAAAGDAQATVSFTAPTFEGVPPNITGYLATSNPGGFTATGSASPLTVTGLTNGTSYTFSVQATNGVQYGPAGTSGGVSPAAPAALFGGGRGASPIGAGTSEISRVEISTTGNATSFGDLDAGGARFNNCGFGNGSRAFFAGGWNDSSATNVIDTLTHSSGGDTTSWGTLSSTNNNQTCAHSNSTTAVMQSNDNILQINLSSSGNSTSWGNFGQSSYRMSMSGNATRAITFAGIGFSNTMNYLTIATTGSNAYFGDVSNYNGFGAAAASDTRCLNFGGTNTSPGNPVNIINYVTIATTGNAQDFGDISATLAYVGATSSQTRALCAGGSSGGSGASVNTIQYVTIATTGNSTDFGDLTAGVSNFDGTSNAHGGLS